MDPYVFLSIVGSIASIVSVSIAAPTTRSRFIHIVYALVLTAVVGLSMQRLAEAKGREEALQARITRMSALEVQPKNLLAAYPYTSTSDVGENRGFILAGLAFLEKNKQEFPDIYGIAKQLAVNGIHILESAGAVASDG